jgi:hypothetical protein
MKVIHVLKKIEQIDDDIKELRKMEKALQRNKAFTTPIFMTIEKQINIMLGDRNKLLQLQIENAPEHIAREFDGEKNEEIAKPLRKTHKKVSDKKSSSNKKEKQIITSPEKKSSRPSLPDNTEIPMMTQDMIDSRFNSIKTTTEKKKDTDRKPLVDKEKDDDKDIKLLDIALEKGTLNQEVIDKEKKRVRFFRNNFPGGEY